MGITIVLSSLGYLLIPNALTSPGFAVLDRWPGGSRLYFLLLLVSAAIQTGLYWFGQLHLHPYALFAEGVVLWAIGVSLVLAAVDRQGQGGGGAILFLGLAVIHLTSVRQAWRDKDL